MKYKNIYSAIHNFGASFTSLMNYVDDDYVIDDLEKIHHEGHDIELNWLTNEFKPSELETERIKKSISNSSGWLKKHLISENVEIEKISSLYFKWPANGEKYMLAEDDRGKEYKIYVSEIK